MPMRLQRFQGCVPRTTPRQLNDTQAQALFNFRLTSGRLEPLYYPKSLAVTSKTGGIKSIYRLYDATHASYWLSWLEDVDVCRGPIAGDASFRFYFTSASFEPRQSNLALATQSAPPYPSAWYVNGVTPPVTMPAVAHASGAGSAETRIYCSTAVTEWGEESSPSPSSAAVVGTAQGAWTITVPDVAPANSYAITSASWATGVLTLYTSNTFGLRPGEYVTLSGFAPAALNASFKVATVTNNFGMSMYLAANPGTITDGVGTATRDAPHHVTNMVKRLYRSVTSGSGTAFYLVTKADGSPLELPVASTTFLDGLATTNRARTANVATLTFVTVPAYIHVGDTVTIMTVGGSGYNTTAVITAVTATTISYASTGTDEVTTADTAGRLVFTVGEPIATTDWDMPPVNLQGVKLLPCGSLVGFAGNEICFSEPSAPYAWPVKYRMTCAYPIVGIGVFGTSMVACTEGVPEVVSGSDPETMSKTKVDQQWPCLSKRSIVDMGYGVVWSCPLGLAEIGVSGAQLLTSNFYTEREWAAINPSSLISAYYGGRYYGAYQVDAQHYGVLILDGQSSEAVVTFSDLLIPAFWTDPATGILYVSMGDDIKQWDADTTYRLIGQWFSKEFVLPEPSNFAVGRVEGEFFSSAAEESAYAAAVAAQRALNALIINDTINDEGSLSGDTVCAYSLGGSAIVPDALIGDGAIRAITFELWADGKLFASKTVNQDQTFRLPGVREYDNMAIRVLGNVPIDAVLIGETADSLRQV